MPINNVLALDVGERRVGLALAYAGVRVAVPLTTLTRQGTEFWDNLGDVITKNQVGRIVVGLPRGLEGQDTMQTRLTREFGRELESHFKLPIIWQDEALTSVKAEAELSSRGKSFSKATVDALAASYILTDYLTMEHD